MLAKLQPAVYEEREFTDLATRNSSNPKFVKNVTAINVKRSVKAIISRSYILEQMIEKGEIAVIGAIHDLESGVVEFYDDTFFTNKKDIKKDIIGKIKA